jgi:hypothetical protein
MRHGTIALVGAAMLSWSGSSLAAGLADRAPAFHLMAAGSGEGSGGAKVIDPSMAAVGLVVGLVVGFGVGEFVAGDARMGFTFLLINGALAAGIAGFMVAGALMAIPPVVGFWGLIIGFWGLFGVRVWELVDLTVKLVVAYKPPPSSEVILPRGGELAQRAFVPALANAVSFRF